MLMTIADEEVLRNDLELCVMRRDCSFIKQADSLEQNPHKAFNEWA